MNCKEVQAAMWCRERSPEMEEHVKSCEACSKEQEMLRDLGFIMERTDIPMPERSLLPSAEEIGGVVRTHKRRRFTRWTSAGVAAACVIAAVALGPQLFTERNVTVPGAQGGAQGGTQQEQVQTPQQTVEQQIDALLGKYQWTPDGDLVAEAYTLPKAFVDAKGKYPAGLYWDYHNLLSKDIGLDLAPHLGQKVTVHSVEVQEQLETNEPPDVAQMNRTRAFFVEADGQVVGAWVRKGVGGPEASLNRKFFADLHQGSWGQWLQEQGLEAKSAAVLSPEDTLKQFFAAFAAQDEATIYGTLSKALQYRMMNQRVPDYAAMHQSWAETDLQLDRIQSLQVKDIQFLEDMTPGADDPNDAFAKSLPSKMAGGIKQYQVILDLKVSEESIFMNGENVIVVTMMREENNDAFPWQISFIKGPH